MRGNIDYVHKIRLISRSRSAALLMLIVLHHILQFLDKISESMGHTIKCKVNVKTWFDTQQLSYRRRLMNPIKVIKLGMTLHGIDSVVR
jgi:hypothetical protein